uniref:Uncharacterized protein n=1 Tax=Arundo donax TaxID=35708 RepID=A0A0A9GB45_ARUDO
MNKQHEQETGQHLGIHQPCQPHPILQANQPRQDHFQGIHKHVLAPHQRQIVSGLLSHVVQLLRQLQLIYQTENHEVSSLQ